MKYLLFSIRDKCCECLASGSSHPPTYLIFWSLSNHSSTNKSFLGSNLHYVQTMKAEQFLTLAFLLSVTLSLSGTLQVLDKGSHK